MDQENPYGSPSTESLPPTRPRRPSGMLVFACISGLMCMPFGFVLGYVYPIEPGASVSSYVIQGVFTAVFFAIPSALAGALLGYWLDRSDAAARRRTEVLARSKKSLPAEPNFDFDSKGDRV